LADGGSPDTFISPDHHPAVIVAQAGARYAAGMLAAPHRLKAKRLPMLRHAVQKPDDADWIGMLPPGRSILRRLRAIRRMLLVLVWTLVAGIIQAALVGLPGRARVLWPRAYWGIMCRLIGLRVRVIGAPAHRTADGRPIVYVSNHSSWLDVLVLGGRLNACFISKEEISRWPLVGVVAKLGRTVYVRRQRSSTGRERDDMRARLAGGDSLILFPEGTTSDGSRVLPFRSAFLSVAELPVTADGRPPLVQPVSVVYDRLAGLPTGRANRPLFAWYGDMDIFSHFWRLAQHRGLRVTVLMHTALDPRAFPSRKALAAATWTAAADGAATLRQNRPARPLLAPGAEAAAEDARPAYV
jgi:1-acyl-sn-glycerol-3-phosphate acyltransferase